MTSSVAIAEDDDELRRVLTRALAEEGFEVTSSATGSAFIEQVVARVPDVLVIDIGLPDSDGRDVCQALRARGVQSPVLFLTARDALVDRVHGFNAGGDDYVTKPFQFDELVLRLRALARRGGASSQLEAGGLVLDPAELTVAWHDREAKLTPTEFRVLAALAGRQGGVVRRREVVAAAWPAGAIVHDNTLDAYIARLRRKLRGLGCDDAIETVHGVGYSMP